MIINNKKALNDFIGFHPDAAKQVSAWQAEVARAEWKTPIHLKEQYGSASILKDRHVIFNVCGNKYRLWVQISYKLGVLFVKAIGTHKEYDSWKIR